MEEATETEILAKAKLAAKMFAERRGYEVLDEDYSAEDLPGKADLVLEEDGEVVLATVHARAVEGPEGLSGKDVFPPDEPELAHLTELAKRWCEENGRDPKESRVDAASFVITGEHRAFLRWHRNRTA